MPEISLPLMQGTKTTSNARYLDNWAVNMVPVPHETQNSSGYLRSFKGIEAYQVTDGASLGAEYNDLTSKAYYIAGKKLYEDSKPVTTLSNPKLTNVCHSPNSTCFVDDAKVKYWRDNKLTELKNWVEGENYVTYPDYKFTPNFNDSSYVTIPKWLNTGAFVLSCDIYFKALPTEDKFIVGSKRADANFSGVFFKAADNKFYYRLSTTDVEIKAAVVGENSISISTDVKFTYNIELIGAVQNGAVISNQFTGEITNLRMYDVSDPLLYRVYTMIEKVEQKDGVKPATPTTKVIKDSQSSTGTTNGTLTGGWADYHEQDEPIKSPETKYDLSGVLDVDRHEGRYVWINKRLMGCTALTVGVAGNQDTSPEQRPDYVAPFYSPESDPDDNKAIRSWQGKYVAVFGRNTTQWFALTGDAGNIYRPQKNYQTPAGIVATSAICRYELNSQVVFAALGGPKGGKPQVIIITPGEYKKISTSSVDIVLDKYKESELAGVLMESVTTENHNFLFIHLPEETLLFDGAQGVWSMLKSGVENDLPYTGRHIIYNHEEGLTIGDRNQGRIGKLKDDISSQYGEYVEHIVYTPFVKASLGRGKARLYDLKFDSIYGHSQQAQAVMISITVDGRSYGRELRYEFNKPFDYTNKTIISNLGSVEESVGFKMRVVSKDPVVLSGFSVRA